MHKTEEYGLEETQKFIGLESSDPTSTKVLDPSSSSSNVRITFNGLSKNEILKFGSDPFWVKLRWAMFAFFAVAWVGMLAFAVLIVVFTPKCPHRPKQEWWDREVVYQLDVAAFKDSDGDGRGDLKGLVDKLDYFDKLEVKALCLRSNLLDENDPKKLNAQFGDENALKDLKKSLDEKDMFLLLDIPVSVLDSASNGQEIISKWLTTYADAIRVTQLDKWSSTAASDDEKTKKLAEWIKLGEDIAQKTFKPKMVMLYPYTPKSKESPQPELVVSPSLLEIKDDDLTDASRFLAKVNFTHPTNSYILNDWSKADRIRDRLSGTKYRATYHGLALLLKGTPFLMFGDELEYDKTITHMKWDNSRPACGFTTSNVSQTNEKCENTVKHAQAYGGSQQSLLKLYEQLVRLRRMEPSFKWGDTHWVENDGVNLVSYVREADRFDGFLVVGNLDVEAHLVDFKARHSLPDQAKVELYHAADGRPSADFAKPHAHVQVDNVQVKPGDLLVLRFTRQPAVVVSEGGSSSAGHG